MNQYIDVFYYINLDYRTDRNQEILDELHRMDVPSEKIVRIPGIRMGGQGDLGCSLSHIKALEHFVESPHQHCIIFEDDFTFTQDKTVVDDMVTQLFTKDTDYDVCQLSYNMQPSTYDHPEHSFIRCVHYASTASGYMVSKKFALTLLNNYRESSTKLEQCYQEGMLHCKNDFAVDCYWNKVQIGFKWFLFSPKLGKQRGSWSDIQNNYEDYNT